MQAITSDFDFMQASCSLQFKLSTSFYCNTLTFSHFLLSFSFSFSSTVAYVGFWNPQHEERGKSKAATCGTFFGFLVILPLPSCRQVAAYNSIWVRVFTATHSPLGISFFLFLPLQLTQGFETLNMKREENLRLRHVGLFFGFLVILPLLFLHRFVLLPPPSVALHIKFQTYVTPWLVNFNSPFNFT